MPDRSDETRTSATQPSVTLDGRITMPQLGLGVWQTLLERVTAVVTEAVEAGYKAVDTTADYKNEAGMGGGRCLSREQIVSAQDRYKWLLTAAFYPMRPERWDPAAAFWAANQTSVASASSSASSTSTPR